MVAANVLVILLAIVRCLHLSDGSSHWVVTENGRVQAQLDTVFNLRRPYDLVAFMKQEDRGGTILQLKRELLQRKEEIDKNEDRDTGLEQRFYKTDIDCVAAGKPLPEFDLYISTVLPLENKGIRPEEHIDLSITPRDNLHQPDCRLFSELEYSFHAFEHLEGMKDRETLQGTPELGLKNAITYQDSVDEYGHRIYEALQKNRTSWILYNMAAFYWRIKGDPYHAIECVRRALHFSPRHQKDVALISLANILHRARYSNEAAVVVHAALDVSKELNVNHFTLGNIYAVLAEYNKSIICFENTLRIQPDFDAAAKRKHAVLCHAKLEEALEAQHRSLQQTLNDLKEYQRKHDIFQSQTEKLISEQVTNDVKLDQHISYENMKLRESAVEIGEYCRMVDRDGKQVLMCTWGKKDTSTVELDFAPFFDDSKKEEKNQYHFSAPLLDIWTADLPASEKKKVDYSKPIREPFYTKEKMIEKPKFQFGDPDAENEWPSREECDTYVQKVPDPRNLSTVYLSPENKGFEVNALLSEAQNIPPGEEHPLPWYPPVCVPLLEIPEGSVTTYDHIPAVSREQRVKMPLKLFDKFQKKRLINHVPDRILTAEEVGQRLLTALKEKIGPEWILYNVAGLYWRVIGNNYHGIECFRRSLYFVQPQYKDVPLVNLANILYMWGKFEDGVKIMKDALAINDLEPDSHFLYGNLLWVTKNYTGAVKHYEKTIDIEPEHQEAFNALRAIKCYLKYHHSAQSAAPAEMSQPNLPNCPQRAQNKGQDTESRVICKNMITGVETENGEEKCVIETRSRSKSDCNGHCTQTCTVTPIKLDSCTGDITIDQPSVSDTQCSQKGPNQPYPNSEEPVFSADFSSKLDEVSDHYMKQGLCEGEECSQLRVQCLIPMKTHTGLVAHIVTPPKLFIRPVSLHTSQCMQGNQRPHIKLEFIDGVLHQKFIFMQTKDEVNVDFDVCVIFNDGTKTPGCDKPEFKTYLEEFDKHKEGLANLESALLQHLNSKCASKKSKEKDEKKAAKAPEGPEVIKETKRRQSRSKNPQEPNIHDGKEVKMEPVEQLPDSELPDTSYQIGQRYHMATPTTMDCNNLPNIKFSEFTSTFLSVTAKQVDLRKHIDFETVIRRYYEEPVCMTEFSSSLELDNLPGMINRDNLQYQPESGLREVLQKLGGEPAQRVEVIGTRIANALKKNMTSWILTNVAALYWRVEGDAKKAIDCLRLSLTTAPRNKRDTALISIANIFHRAGYINDAIFTTNLALDTANKVAVSHFTMANLYAVKAQWDKATMFYESTLGLQSTFEPAKQRLKAIKCKIVMQKPVAMPTD
ncbi:tetratricopeptide repeat protein 17-like isoform X6 [Mytilus edulis]|uniref:tetratricopeptide repeat protein 17-like isoform X6 n=1 Tax=Mytilus edulis TaxID=6550 RepID=UPI0039EFB7C3